MDYFQLWQLFLILGLVLCALEILLPGVILLPIGIGALVAAIPSEFIPLWATVLVWALASLASWKFLYNYFGKANKNDYQSGVDAMLGISVRVIEAIDPDTGKGTVELYGDAWTVMNADVKIETGAEVKITQVTGNRVKVQRI